MIDLLLPLPGRHTEEGKGDAKATGSRSSDRRVFLRFGRQGCRWSHRIS